MEPFKNKLSADLVRCLAAHLCKQLPDFDSNSFCQAILDQLEQLELKQRAQLIAEQLHVHLPADFDDRARVLRAMLHPEPITLSEERHSKAKAPEQPSDERGIRSWGMMPLCMVVGQHGLEDFDGSLLLLRDMTSRFTAEFDVRFFMLADQPRTMAVMKPWINDVSPHVRRLVSEGTRPRLPWGAQLPSLIADPSPMIPLLTALRDDPSEYVRRSVANHLNDIAKDHPELIAELCHEWMQDADANRARLLRHACRTLIKQGHAHTLSAFGLEPPRIKLRELRIDTTVVQLGKALEFEAIIASTSDKPQRLIVDYLLYFMRANGSLSTKVFKWKKLTLNAGEELSMQKSHALRAVTTRRYYPGEQALSLRINGEDIGMQKFELQLP